MSLVITEAAAQFLLARVRPDQLPLRLTKNQKGCGDIAHKFEMGARQRKDDTLVDAHGIQIVCEFDANPEFENALIELHRSGNGTLAKEVIVVIPDGATLCGCGESAAMPPKK